MNTETTNAARTGEVAQQNPTQCPIPASFFPLRAFVDNGWPCVYPRLDESPGSKNNYAIAECQSDDDAAFIVRACNSHAALVEALEKAGATVERIARFRPEKDMIRAEAELYALIRAALALAKGGQQ